MTGPPTITSDDIEQKLDGVRKLLVICPAFVSDCLETVEEIGMRGREIFLNAGGAEFTLIPCLNDHPIWIDALEKMVTNSFTRSERVPARAGLEVSRPHSAAELRLRCLCL